MVEYAWRREMLGLVALPFGRMGNTCEPATSEKSTVDHSHPDEDLPHLLAGQAGLRVPPASSRERRASYRGSGVLCDVYEAVPPEQPGRLSR